MFVETLDRSFESVCELDLIFNSPKARAHANTAGWLGVTSCVQAFAILDEIVMGGAVFETSSLEALRAFNEMQRRVPMRSTAPIRTADLGCRHRLEKVGDTLASGSSLTSKFRR